MKPRIKLAGTRTPDGGSIALYMHDGDYSISLNGYELMHSYASASEHLLGELGMARLKAAQAARILIGGLGLGFTLKSVLESAGAETTVEIVELIPEVILWNRAKLQELNGLLLDDPRVAARVDDVGEVIRAAVEGTYDVILLDVDNGPVALVNKTNTALYSRTGIRDIWKALKPGGRAVLWSAGPDQAFADRLRRSDFTVQAVPAKAHEGARRATYLLYVADRDGAE